MQYQFRMANPKAKTKEAVVKVKKTSAVKVRTVKDARPFLSTPGVRPFNELSEIQLVAEGYRNPLLVRPNFKKDEKERYELSVAKFKKKDDTPWAPYRKMYGVVKRLTIHVKNEAKPEERSTFKTTYTADLKECDIPGYLDSIGYRGLNVTKMTYGGKKHNIWLKD